MKEIFEGLRPSRRALLAGTATIAVGSAFGARAHVYNSPIAEAPEPSDFEAAFEKGAVEPFRQTRVFRGPRLSLPLIDPEAFSKEGAVPPHIWGIIYEGWQPDMEREGVSVFIQSLENRGPDNLRKRYYMSAVTPDLYERHYRPKARRFLDALFAPAHAGEPLMRHYYAAYLDLYWDLHVGVSGEDVPEEVRQYGEAFNAIIGFWDPAKDAVRDSYRTARERLPFLRRWVDERVGDVIEGRTANPEATFVHYWMTNARDEEHFSRTDVVTECIHNFLALSQWGNMLYRVMDRLAEDRGDEAARESVRATMAGDPESPGENGFTPLDRLVMELFRTLSPNDGSLSTLAVSREEEASGLEFIIHPHPATSEAGRHWEDPDAFDPGRYAAAPVAAGIDEAHCQRLGFARCPFSPARVAVADGRDAALASNGFGTVYPEFGGRPVPLVDTAGYAPFGFGYRRCAGEFLTVEIFKDLIRKVHGDGIRFVSLGLSEPQSLPVGPLTAIDDDIGFRRG